MNNQLSTRLEISEVMTLGKALASSNYFDDAREAAQAVVKILAGQELGVGPVAAMTGIHIVKGKIVLGANLMAGIIKGGGKYNYHVHTNTSEGCTLEFFQGETSIGISEFSMKDAKKAGLTGNNWQKYPRNMLFARALSNGAKWFCPDAFNGQTVYTPEELEDQPAPAFQKPSQKIETSEDETGPMSDFPKGWHPDKISFFTKANLVFGWSPEKISTVLKANGFINGYMAKNAPSMWGVLVSHRDEAESVQAEQTDHAAKNEDETEPMPESVVVHAAMDDIEAYEAAEAGRAMDEAYTD